MESLRKPGTYVAEQAPTNPHAEVVRRRNAHLHCDGVTAGVSGARATWRKRTLALRAPPTCCNSHTTIATATDSMS
jgi:hypothetical protein